MKKLSNIGPIFSTYQPGSSSDSMHVKSRRELKVSIKELAQAIGAVGKLDAHSDFSPEVEILDLKVSYGQLRYLVRPVAGTGQVWVDSSRVKIY